MISETTQKAWDNWLDVTRSRCHLHFQLEGGSVQSHIDFTRQVGNRVVNRVVGDLSGEPASILEVGSSVGFNCLAFAERFPKARVVGIEPDVEACIAGTSMAKDRGLSNVVFVPGVGEKLPFGDQSFDWIICHTVIEHVDNVDDTLDEMARVLKKGGFLHLDAPNYLFPWEPHLQIVMPPLCPKPLVRLLARMQGKGKDTHYAGHLKWVHPFWLERKFKQHGLSFENRMIQKMQQVVGGDCTQVQAYEGVAHFMRFLNKIGLARSIVWLLIQLRLYPSLLYTVHKPVVGS